MKYVLVLICGLISFEMSSQREFSGGLMPELSLGYSLNNKVSVLHKLEYQQAMFEESSSGLFFELQQADLQHFIAYEISPILDIAGGYQTRFDANGINHHRSIQQISWVSRLIGLRIGYRFRTDQTFSNEESPEYRFRVRMKSQFPLQGLELDQGEQYLVVSNEIIYSTQSIIDDLENRLNLGIGHYFNDNNKLEVGLDWRTDDYLEEGFRHRLWLKASYYLNL